MNGPFSKANKALVEAINSEPYNLEEMTADESAAYAALLVNIDFFLRQSDVFPRIKKS